MSAEEPQYSPEEPEVSSSHEIIGSQSISHTPEQLDTQIATTQELKRLIVDIGVRVDGTSLASIRQIKHIYETTDNPEIKDEIQRAFTNMFEKGCTVRNHADYAMVGEAVSIVSKEGIKMPPFERLRREIDSDEMSIVYHSEQNRLDFYTEGTLDSMQNVFRSPENEIKSYAKTLYADGTWTKIKDFRGDMRWTMIMDNDTDRDMDREGNNNELNVEQLIVRLYAIENKLLIAENIHLKSRLMLSQIRRDIEEYSSVSGEGNQRFHVIEIKNNLDKLERLFEPDPTEEKDV